MADDARRTAFDALAPEGERDDAMRQLAAAYGPRGGDLLPPAVVQSLMHDMAMLKAQKVIPFPQERARMPARAGMQSSDLDEGQIAMAGDFYEPPGLLTPEMARRMVDGTPILTAIVMTRQRQVSRFCGVSEDDGLGFSIRHVDAKHELSDEEEASIRRLNRFFANCGWEWNPRKRKALKRTSFPALMAKLVRDTLTLDRAVIEVEDKRDKALGMDGLYAVDGGTFRLCPPGGFRGDPSIYGLQVVNGRIETLYPAESIIFEARNPRADVRFGDYGYSELETLVQTVTGFLNAMNLNVAGFDKNSIPKGMLHLVGEYGDDELASFRRYWTAMLRGAANAWQLPIMASKDPQGKAQFERFGVEFNEMYFGKWMTFLTSLACGVYSMDPNEINFESFTNGTSSLSGSDTEEKLAASKDKGLRPLLTYFEGIFTDYVVQDFGEKYCFRFIGLDPRDEARDWEGRKLVLTVDELRARMNEPPHPDKTLGGAPLNPALIGLYQQSVQPQGQDFGGGGGDFGEPEDGGADAGGDEAGADDPAQDGPQGDMPEDAGPGGQPAADFGKALAPIFAVGA